MPFFSLVVSTKGRVNEVAELLSSLHAQSYRDFEVLVVDQNSDDRLFAVVNEARSYPIAHLLCPGERGLSRGRNVGWHAASGTFVCFPDDDCWYDPGYLAYAKIQLEETGADVLTGRSAAADGRSINGRFEGSAQNVSCRRLVWTTQIEWVAFFRRTTLQQINGYDEDVGIGAASPWQSCEGQEIVLRALLTGATCYYDPDLVGRHAEMRVDNPSPATIRKARAYGRGMGHVLRKHKFGPFAKVYWISRPLAHSALMLASGELARTRYYLQVAVGRLEGAFGRILGALPDDGKTS